ncbi:hypothetical protein [Mangrovimonas sp. YM274]|uniref:hypothetical protein n=1 Tax=Mangrovimonas sp. YM274 TaxID=3070660 RepID=UPI0027DC4924|nr:hypothetical protein [Mangrovimonas sp. YM274]WMI68840.1 hypothetical protein RBH95_00390 [Mangrovimonas sp. YM274]
MKTQLLIALLFFSSLYSCCNSDDDNANTNNLEGSWNLVRVTGGFAGVDDEFEPGLIIWDFNTSNTTITVTNNHTENTIYDGLPTGTYNYNLSTTEEGEYITVENMLNGQLNISGNQMTLDDNVTADGFLLSFNKD